MAKILDKNGKYNSEYACTVVRIGEIKPIEGKDRIGHTYVNGESVVIRKDLVKEGDILIYASNETQLNLKFLSANNLFEKASFEMNENADIIKPYIEAIELHKKDLADLERKVTILKKYKDFLDLYETKLFISETNGEIENCKELQRVREVARKTIKHLSFIKNISVLDSDSLFSSMAHETIIRYQHESEKLKSAIEEKNNFIKRNVGFFNKTGRVKMIRLGGIPSMGYLFSVNELAKYCPKVADINIEEYVGEDFNVVDGEEFVKAYVPFVPERKGASKEKKRNKKIERFDRMVKGEFSFHYDTQPLPKFISKIEPDDVVTITVKVHGTSAILGNVKVKTPIKLPFFKHWWNKIATNLGLYALKFADYTVDYGNVTSSRTVIKNKYINEKVTDGYYEADLWTEYGNLLFPYLDKGMIVYGEIYGYITGSEKMIQKNYDYGCEIGENKLMPYRITTTNEDGTKREWNVEEVREWTVKLIEEHPELETKVTPITILYHGTLQNLYPHLPLSIHWHENVLQEMRNDEKTLGMEKDEPMCKTYKSVREGICIRIDDDEVAECFKLKSYIFQKKEAELMTEIEQGKAELSQEMKEAYC